MSTPLLLPTQKMAFPSPRSLLASSLALLFAAVGTTTAHLPPLPVTVLHDFGYPSWLENLAVRSNGAILTSRLDTPVLYQVDHVTGNPVVVATWDDTEHSGALGISETTPDVFYVIVAAQFDQETFVKTGGVNSVYEVNMNTFALADNGSVAAPATVKLLVDVPGADFLNGMATLDDGRIYVSDVYNGWVYLIDTTTGAYRIAVNDPLMKFSVNGTSAATNLGVNGLKVRDGFLYWTNTNRGFLARIPVGVDGLPTGLGQVAATNLPKADDFQFRTSNDRGDGTVFVAQNQQDTLSAACGIEYVSRTPVWAVPMAGNNQSTVLAGVTAGKFGRTASDGDRLYLSTSGGKLKTYNPM